MPYVFAGSFQPVLGIAVLALLQTTVFATTNVTEIQTFELGSNVNLTCGNTNLSSATVLSWSKDGENVLVNITFHNQSTLVLSNLEANGSGLYLCMANSSLILRRVRLDIRTRGIVPEEEEFTPEEGLTRVDIIAIIVGIGLTTFLVVSIALLLYRAEKRRREAKYTNRWKISVKGRDNMAVEEEFTKMARPKSAFYIRTGSEPNRPPPPYKKPLSYGIDNHGIKYEVDENANENNNDGILQWRFTAYL